jgi:hypothetical protein
MRNGQKEMIPKDTQFLELEYYWINRTTRHATEAYERIIEKHPGVAAGWTLEEFEEMKHFLCAQPVIIEGKLRLIPSAAAQLYVNCNSVRAHELLTKCNVHIEAGRVPVIKDETRQHILKLASQFDDNRLFSYRH